MAHKLSGCQNQNPAGYIVSIVIDFVYQDRGACNENMRWPSMHKKTNQAYGRKYCSAACEELGQSCLAVEQVPIYVDSVLGWWTNLSGKEPIMKNGLQK